MHALSPISLTLLDHQVDVLRQQLADEQLRRKVDNVDDGCMRADWGNLVIVAVYACAAEEWVILAWLWLVFAHFIVLSCILFSKFEGLSLLSFNVQMTF